jgi:hypothetical protein
MIFEHDPPSIHSHPALASLARARVYLHFFVHLPENHHARSIAIDS